MKIQKKRAVIILILLLTIAFYIYSHREYIINIYKAFLIESIISPLHAGIKIEDIDEVSLKGVRLVGVSVYRDNLYREKLLDVSHLYMKFSLLEVLRDKRFSPIITFADVRLGNIQVNGSLGFSIELAKKGETLKDAIESIQNIHLHNLSVKTAFFNIKDLSGLVNINPRYIKTSNMNFFWQEEPCKLDLGIADPTGELSLTLRISSSMFNLTSNAKKEGEIYKIPKLEGNFFNSSFEFTGELENIKDPAIYLSGKVNLDAKDIVHFVSGGFKNAFEFLHPEGNISNSIHFRGKASNFSDWIGSIKSDSESLKVWDKKLTNFYMDTRINGGIIYILALNVYSDSGNLSSTMTFDPRRQTRDIPYSIKCRLSDMDIAALLNDTKLKNKNIRGCLFSEFAIEGDAKSIDTFTNTTKGSGRISITEANLGPMPLLAPLVGNLYGYFQNIVPGLKKIDITKVSADFYIANRKVVTENFVLWGDIINVYAKGYIDFDKNLDFEVENKFMKPEETKEQDWQKSIQEMIVQFGRLMSKARLTGTLQKPKWKFEYLGGAKDIFKGGLDKIFKGILEE